MPTHKRPSYSTFRSSEEANTFPTAISHGNILNFTPPGFKQSLNVKFPDSRLAVCEACKKNFKTRDTCRVRNQHTAPPWTMAYICMTLDDSCLDEHGRYVDKPMICRMVEWQPYRAMTDFDKKTPVCAICKKTNRTRSFCRDRHKHRQLPWCTVYVMLSTLDSVDPSTVVAAPSKPIGVTVSNDTEDPKHLNEAAVTGGYAYLPQPEGAMNDRAASESPPVSVKDESSVAESKASDLSENFSPGDDTKRLAMLGVGDDINNIHESRTMLVKVSTVGTVIVWLENGDDGQLSRRNLSNVLEEHAHYPISASIPHPISVAAWQQQRVQDQNSFSGPIAYGMVHPNAAHQHYFHHHMQQRQQVQYGAPGWPYGAPLPQSQHQHQCQGDPQLPPHQQNTSAQYVPIIQLNSSTPVSGPNTPVVASPPTTTPPNALTAGEAAAQQCLNRTLDTGLGQNSERERRVSQSPTDPPMQPPPPTITRVQHPQAFVHYPTPIMAHAPPHLNQPTYHPELPHREQSLPLQHVPPFHYQDTWVQYPHMMYHTQPPQLGVSQFQGTASPSTPVVPLASTEISLHGGPRDEVEDSMVLHSSTGDFPFPGKRLSQFPPVEGEPCLDGDMDAEEETVRQQKEKVEDDENNLNCSKRLRLS